MNIICDTYGISTHLSSKHKLSKPLPVTEFHSMNTPE